MDVSRSAKQACTQVLQPRRKEVVSLLGIPAHILMSHTLHVSSPLWSRDSETAW